MTQTVTCRLRTRKTLMMSCASIALAATAFVPQKALAQAFLGTPTTASGSVTYIRSNPGTETIVLRSSTATINWTPTTQQPGGGPIDFLPAGNTATFSSGAAITDYTVLNRITPASGQAIALNGHVISTLQEGSEIGGHVWFYAPGGIVVGSTAVFDVGSLLLTTNNVTNFSTSANGFSASFSGPSGSTSSIQIQSGAQINSPKAGSYVALIAPRIEQGGTVRVNGSAAYAAGEQLTMTMNQGLFDIQINVGTTDGNGIVHTGETSGPANTTAADNHKIYMVAVPKNQALTMLLGGTVGFDDAVSASVENGQILLSSGWGVHDSDGSGQFYNVNRGLNSNIDIESGNFTSDVTAWGQGTLQANAQNADIHFGGDLELNSWGGSGSSFTTLTAFDDRQLDVAGNLMLLSSEPGTYASAQVAAYNGGAVNIGGSASLNAWDGPNGGDVGLAANGGTISIAGAAMLNASGNGGKPTGSVSGAADSYGGSASVEAFNGGAITTGDLTLDASAIGQANFERGPAGNGYGGDVWITADHGSVTVNGSLAARANGTGGNATGQAGNGNGGGIELSSDTGTLDVTGTADLQANGVAGAGSSPGAGSGGFIGLFTAGGSIKSNSLLLAANGTNAGGVLELGSDGDFAGNNGLLQFGSVNATANGGDTGGQISVTSGSGSTVDLGNANLTASGAFGGSISLLAGTCFDCGGGDGLAARAAALPTGGGIAASSLALNTTGDLFVRLSGGADVSVSGDLNGNAGQGISLVDDGTGGAIRGDTIDLTSITLDSNALLIGNLVNLTTASDMSVGPVQAAQSATFTAGGLASFNGDVSSPTITVTSGDIDVGQGASLGVSGVTNLLTLNAVSNGLPIILGNGTAGSGQYHLGNEAGDIRATSVVINAQGTAPDVNVFDSSIDGSATNGGGITNLTLNTTGNVMVNGLVGWTNAGANDTLTINAGNSIQVNTDIGGIQITNASGGLAGKLSLNAGNVWVASGALLTQLQSNVNFPGRDVALGTNSGTANPQGFVRAGTITAGVANTFLVQNSGTPQLFAGIDTGAGGLSVNSTGTTPAILIIYGRQTTANGTVITNEDFLGSVNVGGSGGFTPDSSVNGCEIGSTASCNAPTFFFDNSSLLGPLSKDDDDKKKDQEQSEGTRVDPSMRLINTAPINLDHTINDPVTSGGDVIVGGPVQP